MTVLWSSRRTPPGDPSALCSAFRPPPASACRHAPPRRRLQPGSPPDPRPALLRLSRHGRALAQGQAAPRPPGIGPRQRQVRRTRHRRRPAGQERSRPPHLLARQRRAHAAAGIEEAHVRQGQGHPPRLDRRRRQVSGPLGVLRTEAGPLPKGSNHPIDAFVRARLDKEGLKPSPEADRYVLVRRVTSTSPASRPRPKRPTPSPTTDLPTPTRSSWTAC